ncbi:MAG: DUF1566 domain-containing protein [Gammaproteobacteria bacterium]|nr:DUF1566 domain-containing protein [Gammaproteobacteria bacterium]
MKKLAIATLTSAILTACGGGSSEPEPPQLPVNQAPTVTISNETNYNEQTTVSITAYATDSDGSISTYSWTQTSGESVTLNGADSANLSFTSPTLTEAARLSFEVTVTDDDGDTASSTVSITIDPVNSLPTISIEGETEVNEQTSVDLTATATDIDGHISDLLWSQVGGTDIGLIEPTEISISFDAPTVTVEEVLTFEVVVTDNEGGTTTQSVDVTVSPVNAAPKANSEAEVIVNPDVLATVSGTSSSDEDGTIEAYTWAQTAGTDVTLTGADSDTLTFTPPTAIEGETLTFELTVTDNEGATHTDSVDIYINEHPVAVAAQYQIVETGYEVSIDANDSTDDGQIVEYSWVQTDGTDATITGADTVTPTFTTAYSDDEKITFEVTVTDDMGLTSTAKVDIDVVKINRFINDTGVTVSASASAIDSSCIATDNKAHDCEHGRDADDELSKIGAGLAGFDYTKLDDTGAELAADASSWSCVRDNHTGLIWEVKTTDGGAQHYLDGFQWGGKGADGYSDANKEGTYYESWNSLIDHANDNSLCGKTNWAIPTHEELTGIVHRGKSSTLVDLAYFPNTVDARYWTTNPSALSDSDSWIVDFGTVYANDDGPLTRAAHNRVRLVSGGEAKESVYLNKLHLDSRYIISDDGTVTDLDTGLMWTRCVFGQSWDKTEQTCSGEQERVVWLTATETNLDNTYAGHNNWRLPNVNELKTIFDLTKAKPSINTVAFPSMPTDNATYFWSSTPDIANNFQNYSLAVSDAGDVYSWSRASTMFVYLVRNLHD